MGYQECPVQVVALHISRKHSLKVHKFGHYAKVDLFEHFIFPAKSLSLSLNIYIFLNRLTEGPSLYTESAFRNISSHNFGDHFLRSH